VVVALSLILPSYRLLLVDEAPITAFAQRLLGM